ncbi:cytochrome P450 2J6 [Esox lucius]|uniref:cytochrome P450 2J6 n=1 Tax=Esox lucius TaxID=8010 RepID=UPI001476B320|nr:cytochrome P450 2J6 [Esox lucius]
MAFFSFVSEFWGWQWTDIQVFLFFSAVFLLLTDYAKNIQPANFPPGPRALPFIGNLFTVDFKKLHENCTQLSEKYGDVYSLRMGQTWMVVLNGYQTIKEALVAQGASMADRPIQPILEDVNLNLGVISSNGHRWKQQRQFALSTLKYFGVGKKSLESAILDEFKYLSTYIAEYKGKPFNPHLIINNAVSNIICSLVFGHRFEYSNARFQKVMSMFDQALQIQGSIWAQLYNSFPVIMRRLPGPHQSVQNIWNEVKAFLRTEFKEHRKNWNPSDPKDYIDCYLSEIEKTKDNVSSTFDEENLAICTLDLFVAGSETTSTTLRWGFLYMSKYPEIQEKVQAEIDRVVGRSRQPTMADRTSMPYTEAVIHEVQRMGNIVPLSVPRMTSKDVRLGGYVIPKGVTIITNLTSVMFDKSEWKTPYTFNPGHFLNEKGNFDKRASFIPFSAGKRVCLGENLARMELFLFFTSFMQRFSFSMPPGVKHAMDYNFGVTLSPVSYEICATLRQ